MSYAQVKADLLRLIKRDMHKPKAWITSMIDLYALPHDFPGYATAKGIADPHRKVEYLEQQFAADIGFVRFIPYIELHEFEAMLLASPQRLADYYSEPRFARPIAELVAMAARYANPELIDEGETTAPSRRIIDKIEEYEGDKATAGPQIASATGLAVLRNRCPHLGAWIDRLEALRQK